MTGKMADATFLVLVLLLIIISPVSAQQSREEKIQQSGTFHVNLSKDYVSLQANEAPVAMVLDEIANKAGIAVENGLRLREKITIQFDRVPLEEAIKLLAKNVIIIYSTRDRNDRSLRIARVVVLPKTKDLVSRSSSSVEPGEGNEPAPESFNFQFNPSRYQQKRR
jgi:hypothetical protein